MSLSISAVLELCDQGKNTREIAKELSLRDIGFILKKGQRIISRSGKDRIGKEEMDLVRTGNR